MNKILTIIFAICLVNCSKKYGYIYDEKERKPLEKVVVIDKENPSNKFVTTVDGKFSFSECDDLIIKRDGYITDTLQKYGCKPNGKCFDGHIFYMRKN